MAGARGNLCANELLRRMHISDRRENASALKEPVSTILRTPQTAGKIQDKAIVF